MSLYKNFEAITKNFRRLLYGFKPQMLITNPQRKQQEILNYWTEDDLFDYKKIFRDDNEDSDDYESRLMQDIGRDRKNEASSTILTPGQNLQGTAFRVIDMKWIAKRYRFSESFRSYNGSHLPLPDVSLTAEAAIRYRMAWRAIEYLTRLKPTRLEWRIMPEALVQRYKDWPDLYNIFELPIALGFVAVGLIYGGLHALAWFVHFGSPTEQLLWRISACVVMGGFPVSFVLWADVGPVLSWATSTKVTFLRFIDDLLGKYPIRFYLLFFFQLPLLVLVLLAYILARGYLVVECFINLSHLPAGVYDVPNWAVYFPHIS